MSRTTLISPDGVPFSTSDAGTITRLKYRGYTVPGEADTDSTSFITTLFNPSEHKVDEVLAYLDGNPSDAERVIEAEKAGQNRVSIVGKAEED